MGKDNCQEKVKGFELQDEGKSAVTGRNSRDTLHDLSGKHSNTNFSNFQNNKAGINQDKLSKFGLDQEELDGLNIEERKRRRSESSLNESMLAGNGLDNLVNGDTYMESTLSNSDCVISSLIDLAKYAMQTSQPQ